MKTNLSTFPKPEDSPLAINEKLGAVYRWKENFTKELREELDRIQSDGTSDMLLENFIEEILGE